MDFNPQSVIDDIPAACPACRAENVTRSRVCKACGHRLVADDEDEDRFDVVSADGVPAAAKARFGKKFPVQQSKNLLLAQGAAAGIQDGSLSRELFAAQIEEARRVAEQGVQLFNSEVMKAKIATLPPEQQDLSNQTAALMGKALGGYQQMLQYLSTGNVDDVRSGLQVVEQAFAGLDRVRGRAFEIANAETADAG